MSDRKFIAIIVQEFDETQMTLLHEAVKANSKNWWHQWEDVWIVEIGVNDFARWSERVLAFSQMLHSNALILELGSTGADGTPTYAGRMSKDALQWFRNGFGRGEKNALAAKNDPWGSPSTDDDPWTKSAQRGPNSWDQANKNASQKDPWATGNDDPPF